MPLEVPVPLKAVLVLPVSLLAKSTSSQITTTPRLPPLLEKVARVECYTKRV